MLVDSLRDPCQNDPEFRAQMRFVEEMVRGEVPEVHREGPNTLRVGDPAPDDKDAVKRVKAIEAALKRANWEGSALTHSVIWTWSGGEWKNPCASSPPIAPTVK